jgi:tetratricopeptide (TPR) repeat protein
VALVDWWQRPVLRRGVSRAWAAVGVVATLTGLWGSYGHFFTKDPPPPVMRGTLNLAVADFASADSRGGQATKATAKLATDVATSLAGLLVQQLHPLAGRLRIEVRGPAQFPQIRGASQAAQAHAAKQRAGEIDADVVVYGMLTTDGNTTILQPQLYISDSIQGDTGELVGDHLWGSAIELPGDPESNRLAILQFGEPLSARTKALTSMILGIWYYQAGQPSVALQHLHAAAENPEWRDQEGKQVVYLFLGNAAERQGAQQQRQQHPAAARRSFADAVGYYQQALRVDVQYARAWYGIGETRFLQVGLSCQPDRTNRRLLAQVVRDFERGAAGYPPPRARQPRRQARFRAGAGLCLHDPGRGRRPTRRGPRSTRHRHQSVSAEPSGRPQQPAPSADRSRGLRSAWPSRQRVCRLFRRPRL